MGCYDRGWKIIGVKVDAGFTGGYLWPMAHLTHVAFVLPSFITGGEPLEVTGEISNGRLVAYHCFRDGKQLQFEGLNETDYIWKGKPAKLSANELGLLRIILGGAVDPKTGWQTVSVEEIYDYWQEARGTDEADTVRAAIHRLRKKLKAVGHPGKLAVVQEKWVVLQRPAKPRSANAPFFTLEKEPT